MTWSVFYTGASIAPGFAGHSMLHVTLETDFAIYTKTINFVVLVNRFEAMKMIVLLENSDFKAPADGSFP